MSRSGSGSDSDDSDSDGSRTSQNVPSTSGKQRKSRKQTKKTEFIYSDAQLSGLLKDVINNGKSIFISVNLCNLFTFVKWLLIVFLGFLLE